MKKILAFLFALVMLSSAATACKPNPAQTSAPETPTVSSESTLVTPSPAPDPSPTPTPSEEYVAPSAYTLKGTKHLPIVDSQGSIGSCTSEGITYAQFTVAVSQYMNHHYPDVEWDPSSGDAKYIFSPKFSYNYTAGSTELCYRILVDDGCLPMSISCFEKGSSSPGFWGASILNSEKTRSWDVGEGMMLDALNYRLTDYTEKGAPSSITAGNDPFINEVKEAISRGNAVTVCGGAYNWLQTSLGAQPDGCLAKKGERVIWRAATTPNSGPSGHCVALVGYDDSVTLNVGGSVMQGAFLMMNSWGNWSNNGFVWVMYDACNQLSECLTVSSPAFLNSGSMSLDIASATFCKSLSKMDTSDYVITFTPVGSTTVMGKEYTTYYLSNREKTGYLSYETGKIRIVTQPNEYCVFAFPNYSDVSSTTNKDYQSNATVAVYAVGASEGSKYLKISEAPISPMSLTNDLTNGSLTAFRMYGQPDDKNVPFEAMLYTASDFGGTQYTREAAFNSYGFVYWDENIVVGLPKLSVEVAIETLNRKTLFVTLNRTDGNGNTESYIPAMMQIRVNEGAEPDTGGGEERVSFSGKLDPSKRETGYFTFGYLPLTNLPEGTNIEDYLWGVTVRGSGAVIKQIRLYDENKNVIAEVKPNADAEKLEKGETVHFAFQLQKELYAGIGNGYFALKTGNQILNVAQSGMIFELSSAMTNAAIRFSYNTEAGCYAILRADGKYVMDISGKEIKEGAIVKFNKENADRNTQLWEVTQKDENGPVRIALKADPSFVFAPVNGKLCITQNAENDGYLWSYDIPERADLPILVTTDQTSGKAILSAASDGYTVQVYKQGALVKTLTNPKKSDSSWIYDISDLPAGDYCFRASLDGKQVGTQIAYTVK